MFSLLIIKNKVSGKIIIILKKKKKIHNNTFNQVRSNLPFLTNISLNNNNESFISHKNSVLYAKKNTTIPRKSKNGRRLSMFATRREEKSLTEKIRDSFKFS